METFKTRTLSSGEDVSEIASGMALHGRMAEHTNSEFYSNTRDSFWSGFSIHSTPNSTDSDEHSSHKKTHSYIYTFLSTMLFSIVLIVENIFHYKLFVNSHVSISSYWLESCFIALFFRFWGRKRSRLSFRTQASHFLPLLFLHVAVVTVFALDFNNSSFGISAGSESYLISIALTPAVILLASWVTKRHSYPDKIIIFVAVSSFLLMFLFCTLEDSQADYKVSFRNATFALAMSASLAFFTVHAKIYLPKATLAELLYLLNYSCVICLPFIALLFGELPALEVQLLKRGTLGFIFSLVIMAVLRLASQAAFLYQLKYATPLLSAGTRGLSWIWITIAVTFLTPSDTCELMVTVFLAFWIYGFFSFLPALCSDLHWI